MRGTLAPVVGVSPIIAGRPVRGHADACLTAIGVPTTAEAVAGLYADILTGWLVDSADSSAVSTLAADPRHARLTVRSLPLLMSDVPAAARIAGEALDLALHLRDATAVG
jgi:LPPG:FO 2-phospho-L-lactate transferase